VEIGCRAEAKKIAATEFEEDSASVIGAEIIPLIT